MAGFIIRGHRSWSWTTFPLSSLPHHNKKTQNPYRGPSCYSPNPQGHAHKTHIKAGTCTCPHVMYTNMSTCTHACTCTHPPTCIYTSMYMYMYLHHIPFKGPLPKSLSKCGVVHVNHYYSAARRLLDSPGSNYSLAPTDLYIVHVVLSHMYTINYH